MNSIFSVINFFRSQFTFKLYKPVVLLVFICCITVKSIAQGHTQKQKKDSLIAELKKYEQQQKKTNGKYPDQRDTVKADLLWGIYVTMLFPPDDVTEGKRYIAEIRQISTALNYEKGIANALTGEGVFLSCDQKYTDALKLHLKALEIRTKINDKWGIRWSNWNIGANYQWRSLNNDAASYYHTALKLSEKENDTSLAAYCTLCLGGIYGSLRDFKSAIDYMGRSIKMFEAIKDSTNAACTMLYQVDNYIQDSNTIEAHKILEQAYPIAKKLNTADILHMYYNQIGSVSMMDKRFDAAIRSYQKSIEVQLKARFIGNLPFTYQSIAECILKASRKQIEAVGISEQDRLAKAKENIDKSLSYAIPAGVHEIVYMCYELLSQFYEKEGNLQEALKYYKLYVSKKDTVVNGESSKTINSLKLQYESEKKEKKIAFLNKDKIIQQKEISKQKSTRNAFIGGFILVLLLIGVTLNRYRLKQQANRQLSISLERLKNTQQQLIQHEKMASLGELTAGIAHEIQNPLNFVNNFSEVSNELIDEMKNELKKGNYGEADEIANDVKQNLEKINHHGKRADAIVKGMLQHSRSSSGVKEPTDINALSDEYLRLSYHGLRAKDKSFNAVMKTDFDNSIGNINIIQQDIGRVILNLLTNTFYAVNEKKMMNKEGYEPTVSISTKKSGSKVEIRVSDNGNGIPEKILDKIFQPFFTTKPTGQGTGLGLSLSYDIIKAHGGEIRVETKENEGSTFIIILPQS